MIKRTLYFGNPAYLKTKDEQLVIVLPTAMVNGQPLPKETKTAPIADIDAITMKRKQTIMAKVLLATELLSNVIVLN